MVPKTITQRSCQTKSAFHVKDCRAYARSGNSKRCLFEQKSVVSYLDAALPKTCVFHHSPNEGKRHINYINRLKQLGTKFGWPDLEIFIDARSSLTDRPEVIFIELKLKRGALNNNQKFIRDKIQGAGFLWALCRSIEDVHDVLAAHVQLRAGL